MNLAIQLLGLLGAAIVLAAYTLLSRGRVTATSRMYHGLNALGSLLLLAVAIAGRQLGFIVLNAAWLLVAAHTMLRARPPRADR